MIIASAYHITLTHSISVGDCVNREHIWPKSWFGGFDYGKNAQTDLFELWPSDGYVNGLRGNLPLGLVIESSVTYKSTNGCRLVGSVLIGRYFLYCVIF